MLRALSPGRQAAGYHGPPPKVPRPCGMLECGQGHNLAWQNNALGYDTAWHGLDPSRRAWKRADPPSRFCRKLADQNGQGEPPLSSTGFDLYFVGKARRRACTLSQFPLTILGAKTTRCLVPSLHLCQSRTFCMLFFCLAGCTAPDAANGSSPSRPEGGRRHRGAEEAEAWDWAAVFGHWCWRRNAFFRLCDAAPPGLCACDPVSICQLPPIEVPHTSSVTHRDPFCSSQMSNAHSLGPAMGQRWSTQGASAGQAMGQKR